MPCLDILIWSVLITKLFYRKPQILHMKCDNLWEQAVIKREEMGKWWFWNEIAGQKEDKLNKSLYVK